MDEVDDAANCRKKYSVDVVVSAVHRIYDYVLCFAHRELMLLVYEFRRENIEL